MVIFIFYLLLAIGGSWAKERAGGAFAAGISFILINRITGAIFGVTSDMLANEDAFTHTLFGTKIMVKGFFYKCIGSTSFEYGSIRRDHRWICRGNGL